MEKPVAMLAVVGLASGACSDLLSTKGKMETVGLIPTESLDPVAGGLADDSASFHSLLRLDGVPVVAELTSQSSLKTDVKGGQAEALSAGARVALVAENGKFFRVLVKIK